MNLKFNLPIPNQPFSEDFSEGKTIPCVYTGYRYVVVGINPANGRVMSVDRKSNEPIDVSEFEDDVLTFEQISVTSTNVVGMAAITGDYTHDEVVYSEALNDDETFEYPYSENNGINDIYSMVNNPTWDSVSGTFGGFVVKTHPISQENFEEDLANRIAEWKAIEANTDGELDADQLAEVTAFVQYMENFTTKYAGIEHWKVPFLPTPDITN